MGLLSSGHYTNYPPLNQLLFAVAAFLGGSSLIKTVVWLRIILIAADIGIVLIGTRLLRLLKLPALSIALYFLNPFVILELTGNLHFEGVMAFFLLLAVYLLGKNKWLMSSLSLAAGVLVKLLPVIALPLFIKRLGWNKAFLYGSIVAAVCIAGYLPFVSAGLVEKYGASVGLWFGKFEFNASVYYLVRWVGYQVVGYNIIETAGKILPLITLVAVLAMALLRKNEGIHTLISSIVFSFFIYLLFSTTVHPWYLTIPLLFSVFTRYRFMLVWSFLVFLSYSAYTNNDYKEQLWLVAAEYLIACGFLIYELVEREEIQSLELSD